MKVQENFQQGPRTLIQRLAIFLTFNAATGHPHPHQRTAVNNYAEVLQQLGHTDEQVLAKLNEVGGPFAFQLGG